MDYRQLLKERSNALASDTVEQTVLDYMGERNREAMRSWQSKRDAAMVCVTSPAPAPEFAAAQAAPCHGVRPARGAPGVRWSWLQLFSRSAYPSTGSSR